MINDESLIQEFLSEAREHLASIEPDFLTLEQNGESTDAEVINRIFRAIHSIKGASGFFGFEAVKQLSHAMENVLMRVRDGKLPPSTAIISPLLTGTDLLSAMLDNIAASDQIAYAAVVDTLNALIHPVSQEQPAFASVPLAEALSPEIVTSSTDHSPELQPSSRELEAANSCGQTIYAIRFEAPHNLQTPHRSAPELIQLVESLGACLRHEETESPYTLSVLLASVLELDLIALALDISPTQIVAFSSSSARLAPEADKPLTPEIPPYEAIQAPQEHCETPTAETQVERPPATSAPVVPANTTPRKQVHGTEAVETIRVRVDILNNLMNLAGELVLVRNQLLRMQKPDGPQDEGLSNTLQNLSHTTTNLQEAIMQTRMQPIGNILSRFRRLVRDTAQQLGKQIELEILGDEVELDKSMLESLSDPLTHMIRNSCDHGIEPPAIRQARGKDETGQIRIHAYHEGGQMNLLIEDDGQGIDAQKVAQKALQLGLVSPAQVERLSPKELTNLIMMPGFSTADQVSELSGRGVGMDVVRTNIEKLGGAISIESRPGQGTRCLLKLPLTLAIIPSLIVGVEQFRFAIPQLNLVELICIQPHEVNQRIEKVGHATVLCLRGRLLPLVGLADVLGIAPAETQPLTGDMPSQTLYIAILNIGANQYGLMVDHVLNLEEIVIKPLPAVLKSCRAFSGSTIMGDGKVVMILDAIGLADFAQLSFSEANAENQHRNNMRTQESMAGQEGQSMLLFHFASDETFALPLSAILRIEKLKISHIQRMGQQEYLPYQGRGLPLVRLSGLYPVQSLPADVEEAYLIIPHIPGYEFGLIASQILDTIQVRPTLQPVFDGHQSGLAGAAIVHQRMTVFLDPPLLAQRSGLKDWRPEALKEA